MLQSFRDHLKGTVATALVVLISIPFVLFGVETLFVSNGSNQGAAEVNGESISETELRRAVLMRKQQLEQQFGQSLPADFVSEERLRGPVLDGLVRRQVLSQSAVDEGLAVADTILDDLIIKSPQFQVDGKFDRDRYTQMLRSLGYTPANYKRLLEQDVLLTQHSAGIASTGFVTDSELSLIASLSQQTRDFSFLTIPIEKAEKTVELTKEDLEKYYEENKDNYKTEEKVSIEYLELDVNQIASTVEISESAKRQQYNQERDAFKKTTRRHAAHILLEVDGKEQEKIKEIQQKLKEGETFESLAKAYSDDLGTKNLGGDLGASSGDIFPEEIEEALSQLSKGEVSAPVETSEGLHLVKLVDIQVEEMASYEEDESRIESVLKQAEAEDIFINLLEQLEEVSYSADSIKEVADELGLKLKRSKLFSRAGAGASGIVRKPEVTKTAFSKPVLKERKVSDVIELGDSHVVVIQIASHEPVRIKSYEEVEKQLTDSLTRSRAEEIVASKGREIQKKLEAGSAIDKLSKSEDLSLKQLDDIQRTDVKADRELMQHVFSLPKPSEQAVVSGLHLNNGDFVVVKLTEVQNGQFEKLESAQKSSMRVRMKDQFAGLEFSAYESLVKKNADIEIH